METPGARDAVVAMDDPAAPHAADDVRSGDTVPVGDAGTMKPVGETDKNGAKNAKPTDKPAANEHERPDPAAQSPNPPSDSERAAAAKANPLRSPDSDVDEPEISSGDEAASSPNQTGAPSGNAPELRISANMLSAQPPPDSDSGSDEQAPKPSGSDPDEPAPKPSGYSKSRRRVRRLATPVDHVVFNPLNLLWPRATSRKGARRASRYGIVGLVVSLLWILFEVETDTISKAVNFSSSAAAIAALIGAIAVLAFIVIGYYYHSRIAALLSLAGVTALIVLQFRLPSPPSPLELVGQAVLVYMLCHGAYGTIAYHIYGRRKRRKSSKYRYKDR